VFCHNCGQEIDERSNFCVYCGASLKRDFRDAETRCSLIQTLSRRGDTFTLKFSRSMLLVGNGILVVIGSIAFFISLWVMPGIIKIYDGDSAILFVLLPLGALFVFSVVFVRLRLRQLLAVKRIPPGRDSISFTKNDIKRLQVNQHWLTSYTFSLLLQVYNTTIQFPLGNIVVYSKKDAEKIINEFVKFFGGDVPVRWVTLSWKNLKREIRGN